MRRRHYYHQKHSYQKGNWNRNNTKLTPTTLTSISSSPSHNTTIPSPYYHTYTPHLPRILGLTESYSSACNNNMENFVWEALPQRKRRRDLNSVIPTSTSSSADVSCLGVQTDSTNSSEADRRSEVHHQQTITENVRARSVLQRKNATLESLDGCAGEFYECEKDVYDD